MFDGIKSKVETFIPVFEKVGAGVGKGLKLGAETGMSAFNKMIAALGSVFKAAMLSVGLRHFGACSGRTWTCESRVWYRDQ